MKVTLYRDMRAEKWYSMDRYAESLIRQFKVESLKFKVFGVEPPLNLSRVRDFWRRRVYPNFGRFFQGDVNHILDHSYSHLLNYLNPQRTVVTCHDLIPLEFENDPEVLADFKETVDNLKKAARVIAVSESTKTDLINKLGIEGHKIDVVYSGVDSVFHPFDSTDARKASKRKFGLPEGKIILNFGSNLKYKNVEAVLQAFKRIHASYPLAYLLRIHSLSPEQKELAGHLGILSNYLEILSPSDADLVDLYNCGDVFLSPSLKEGFGLHVLEAMACGLPVIISRGTSLQEIAGDYGVMVDSGDYQAIADSVLAVLNNQVITDKVGIISRAKTFRWDETTRKTIEVYRKISA